MDLNCDELRSIIEAVPLHVEEVPYRLTIVACQAVSTLSTACDLWVEATADGSRIAGVRLRLNREGWESHKINQLVRYELTRVITRQFLPDEIEYF